MVLYSCLIDLLSLRLDPTRNFVDLSTARKIKDLVFHCDHTHTQWITRVLQTVESENLQRITLRPDIYTFVTTIQEATYQEWWELDRLLVHFRTSRSICPKLVFEMDLDKEDLRGCALSLLPEVTRRGLVDLVRYTGSQ